MSTHEPGHSNFTVTQNISPSNWRLPYNPNLWQGIDGINNPCPSGYRVPTLDEWGEERASWNSTDAEGAFSSLLKLPIAGKRSTYGTIQEIDVYGHYWTSTIYVEDMFTPSHWSYQFYLTSLYFYSTYTANSSGASVRCIKD